MSRFRRHSLDAETQLDDRAADEDDAAVSERDVMVMMMAASLTVG